MKIYTRGGDGGSTGLFGGARVRKDDPRVEAYGSVDELNACLGMARAFDPCDVVETILNRLQTELFTLGAELSCQPGHARRLRMPLIGPSHVTALEQDIDACQARLPELTTFVLPTGSRAGSTLHLARTICRRAERRTLSLGSEAGATGEELRADIVTYLNRLSDLLFVLARYQNHEDETPETPWSAKHSV